MSNKNKYRVLLLAVLVILLPAAGYSQLDPGGDPEANVPIDGGIGLLLAAGIAYGAKKYRGIKKIEEENVLK